MTEKLCNCCGLTKPVDMFAYALRHDGSKRPHAYCKACRSKMNFAARKRRLNGTATEFMVPTMTLRESLDCIGFREWRGPVTPGLVGARIAA